MRTGLDPVRGEAEDWTQLRGLEIYPVRIGGFGITSKTNELLIISSLWTG